MQRLPPPPCPPGAHHRGRGAGEVAQLLFRGLAAVQQRLVHIPLPGGELPLVVRHRAHHLAGGVPHPADGGVHLAQDAPGQQVLQLWGAFLQARLLGQLVQGRVQILLGAEELVVHQQQVISGVDGGAVELGVPGA